MAPTNDNLMMIITALLIIMTPCRSQSIQGFVYWDADFNGVLSEGVLDPYGIYLRGMSLNS
jgi:hypothetical protein